MLNFAFRYIWTPIAVFVLGYILLRLMGKKAVSEMTGFELLSVLILGTAITEPIVTKRLGVASYYSIAIAVLYLIFSRLSLYNPLKRILNPSPTVLIRHGKIDEKGLKKEKLTVEDLLANLRIKGYSKTSDIELATMEDVGQISFLPKADARPVQPSDFPLVTKPTFINIPIIIDGTIIDHNLKYLNLDRSWLLSQLNTYQLGQEDIKNITLATYNQEGTLDVDTNHSPAQNQGAYNYKPGSEN
ncbi:uncharacterized membrane protein YcaP (DUF421 family) [Scopulibacillus daqui]|uniref:Uncharacterized membrane protein YcaP (DUF421 family) n=1 Tax=Scopulibacillus daqui TaxID=1469162 RepID=A0ABS2Q3C8_9BACL|nr:DUF421 domain-containing protein [Scopulibacillus daqui]MBM7646803.1 uncharacterized membrane protein YcaP (DUF421 family) [Scopulibacillus daqui]